MSIAYADASPRARFAGRVADAFRCAGVEYVFLHARGEAPGSDSDLDVAVARESLDLVDGLVRAGTFGRVLQRVSYDVPWCRCYVLEADEPGRRYRQLDVACDPWGIGRYGKAIPLALARARESSLGRLPDPAAELLYLAVKRARKRKLGAAQDDQLRQVFGRDGESARRLLEEAFGTVGRALADALERDEPDLVPHLRRLDRAVARQRRTPTALLRRACLSSIRGYTRVAHPTGFIVAIAGPDGAGKSTLAEGLLRASAGVFRHGRRLHFGPGVLPPPARLLGRTPSVGDDPHGRPPSGRTGSLARIVYLGLDAMLGAVPRLLVPRMRWSLVVVERGWLDLTADPRRYRLSFGSALVRALGRFGVRPDLILVLDLPAAVARGRRADLTSDEIERQCRFWRRLAAAQGPGAAVIDATASPAAILEAALERIDDRLAGRQTDFADAEVALRVLGPIAAGGSRYLAVSQRRRVRWLLPEAGRRGPAAAALYRPASRRHAGGAAVLGAALRLRVRSGVSLRFDTTRGIQSQIAAALGFPNVELAATIPVDGGRRRTLIAVFAEGRLAAFAKVAEAEVSSLSHEARVLRALATAPLRRLVVPEVVASFEWQGCDVLVLRPLAVRGRSDRAAGAAELAALAELRSLAEPLLEAIGAKEGLIPVHGDFAPWNAARLGDGRLALWDWEDARLGLPLEDLFHWHTQRIVLLGRGTVADLVAEALMPGPGIRGLCSELGIEPKVAPEAFRAYLERSLETARSGRAVSIRQDALALLAEATR